VLAFPHTWPTMPRWPTRWASLRERPLTSRDPAVPSDWSNCTVVIEIPSLSASLDYRPYDDRVGRMSLLDWAVGRLRHSMGDASDVAILVDGADADRLSRALASEPRPSVCGRSGMGDLHDLRDLMRHRPQPRLLVVDPAAALLPRKVLDRLLRVHLGGRHQATGLDGVPWAATPYVLEAAFVSMLTRVPGLARDLRVALDAVRRGGGAGWKPFRARVRRLDARIDSPSPRWPDQAQLRNREDIEVLEAILARCANQPGGGLASEDLLEKWTDVSAEQQRRHFTRLRDCSASGREARPVPRKVLYVQSPSAFTGVEQVLVSLADAVRRKAGGGFECAAMVAKSGTLVHRLSALGLEVSVAGRDFAANSVENYLYSTGELNRMNPGIVHAHTLAGVPFCCAAVQRGIPFVQHVHVASRGGLMALRGQLTLAAVVIAVSGFVRRQLIAYGVDPGRIRVIHNGVPAQAPDAGAGRAVRRTLGLPDNARVVFLAARFARNKRHDVAVEAFARLRDRIPDAYLLIAGEVFDGDQPVFEAVQSIVSRQGLRERVRFLGFQRDMASLYGAADLFVQPSEDDPLSMTVLEAMAAGVPVVAVRSGGTPEMIVDDESGILVEPGSADACATAIERLLFDDGVRRRLSAGALARCRTDFSMERFVGQIGGVYEELLNV
jgi:glycosyltransferase involved in cell wall biosynthesis